MKSAIVHSNYFYQCSEVESTPTLNEPFNDIVVLDLKEHYSHHNCRSIWYCLLSIAAVVAFIALGVLSLISCLETPAFMPLVIFSTLLTLPIFHAKVYKPLDQIHDHHKEQTELLKATLDEVEKLPDSKGELATILKNEMDVDFESIASDKAKADPTLLKSLIARYRVCIQKEKDLIKEAEQYEELLKEAADSHQLTIKRIILQKREDEQTHVRVELAWLHHLARFPHDKKSASDYFEFQHDSMFRAVAQRMKEPDYDTVIQLKGGAHPAVTKTELETLPTIKALSDRIFA